MVERTKTYSGFTSTDADCREPQYQLMIDGHSYTINQCKDGRVSNTMDLPSRTVWREIRKRRDELNSLEYKVNFLSHHRERNASSKKFARSALKPQMEKIIQEIQVLQDRGKGKLYFIRSSEGAIEGIRVDVESQS